MSTAPAQPTPAQQEPDLKILWTRLALFMAVVGVLGSLHLSLSMELRACPLCYYQRAFLMATAGILAFGMFLPGMPTAALTVLALVPAFAGGCIAAEHTRLVITGAMECPVGVSGFMVAPAESLTVFFILIAALVGDLLHRKQYVMQGVGAMLLGLVFCISSLRSVAPLPPDPPGTPFNMCRKPVETKS